MSAFFALFFVNSPVIPVVTKTNTVQKVIKTKSSSESGLHAACEGDIHESFHADLFSVLKSEKPTGAYVLTFLCVNSPKVLRLESAIIC